MMKTTIAVSKELKQKLDSIKVHPRETYEDVIKRLVEIMKNSEVEDTEKK